MLMGSMSSTLMALPIFSSAYSRSASVTGILRPDTVMVMVFTPCLAANKKACGSGRAVLDASRAARLRRANEAMSAFRPQGVHRPLSSGCGTSITQNKCPVAGKLAACSPAVSLWGEFCSSSGETMRWNHCVGGIRTAAWCVTAFARRCSVEFVGRVVVGAP